MDKLDELWCKHAQEFVYEFALKTDATLVVCLGDDDFDLQSQCMQPVLENLQGHHRLGSHEPSINSFSWTTDPAAMTANEEMCELGAAAQDATTDDAVGRALVCPVSKKPPSRFDVPLQSSEAFSAEAIAT